MICQSGEKERERKMAKTGVKETGLLKKKIFGLKMLMMPGVYISIRKRGAKTTPAIESSRVRTMIVTTETPILRLGRRRRRRRHRPPIARYRRPFRHKSQRPVPIEKVFIRIPKKPIRPISLFIWLQAEHDGNEKETTLHTESLANSNTRAANHPEGLCVPSDFFTLCSRSVYGGTRFSVL